MNLCFVVPATETTGLGHYYRTKTLADTAHRLGHQVILFTNKVTREAYPVRQLPLHLYLKVGLVSYDWVIIDSPSELPSVVKVDGIKTCYIDGVGHKNGNKADLVISQGLEGEYCAPDYLILRPELFEPGTFTRSNQWLVWGGAADRLGLLPAFALACPDLPAHLMVSEFIQDKPLQNGPKHIVTPVRNGDLIYWARQCDKTVCAFGMWVWESLALDLTVYAFSLTERHLKSALAMEGRGWIKAYGKTGLPDPAEMRDFLSEPFETVRVEGLDGLGTERCVRLLEEKL